MLGPSIHTIITGNAAINAIISGRCYSISDLGEGFPSVYYKLKMLPQYNKSSIGSINNTFQITILTMCNTYNEAWTLAMHIKTAFEQSTNQTINNIKYINVKCTAIDDDYEFNIDSFGHTITFDIKTNNLN